MVDAALAAIALALFADQRVIGILRTRAEKIPVNLHMTAIAHEQSTPALLPVPLLKVFFGQSVPVHMMVHAGAGHEGNSDTRARQSVCEFHVFGHSRSAGTESFVKSPDANESATPYKEIGSIQGSDFLPARVGLDPRNRAIASNQPLNLGVLSGRRLEANGAL